MEFCSQQIVLYLLLLITASFAKHNITTHTHKGVKAVFGLQVIKEGKIEAKWGKLFTVLFNTRQMEGYGDFANLTEEEILPFIERSGRIQSNDYEITLKYLSSKDAKFYKKKNLEKFFFFVNFAFL